jgi:hypothetical protein
VIVLSYTTIVASQHCSRLVLPGCLPSFVQLPPQFCTKHVIEGTHLQGETNCPAAKARALCSCMHKRGDMHHSLSRTATAAYSVAA